MGFVTGLPDPLRLQDATDQQNEDEGIDETYPPARVGSQPISGDLLKNFQTITAQNRIERLKTAYDRASAALEVVETHPEQDPQVQRTLQEMTTPKFQPNDVDRNKVIHDVISTYTAQLNGASSLIGKIATEAGVENPLRPDQLDRTKNAVDRIKETNRHNKLAEDRWAALTAHGIAQMNLADQRYQMDLADKAFTHARNLATAGSGDEALAIRFMNGVVGEVHYQNMEALAQAKASQDALFHADNALQRQYATETTAASSRYSTEMGQAGAERRNTQDNMRQYAIDMTKELATLQAKMVPEGTTKLVEALLRERARRAGVRMPDDWHLVPVKASSIDLSAYGADQANAFMGLPGAQSQFPIPVPSYPQAPGGPYAGGPPVELQSYPGMTAEATLGLAGQFGQFSGTPGLGAPVAAGSQARGSQGRSQAPGSEGNRPAPEWIVSLVQRNTADPLLKNDADFIRTVAAAIGQETGWSFDPAIVGDQGHSVGLFQMHDQGAGHGLSSSQRSDPEFSAARHIPQFEIAYLTAARTQPDAVGTPAFAGQVIQQVQRANEENNPVQLYANAYQAIGPVRLPSGGGVGNPQPSLSGIGGYGPTGQLGDYPTENPDDPMSEDEMINRLIYGQTPDASYYDPANMGFGD